LEITVLKRQLTQRFGHLSDTYQQPIEQATLEQLIL
jgi:hypothetical protein